MNVWQKNYEMSKRYREKYPPGTRLMLLETTETLQPVPIGMKGTVTCVDDQSQIHMQWDNGRTLPIVPGEDSFRRLTEQELQEEQSKGQNNLVEGKNQTGGMML